MSGTEHGRALAAIVAALDTAGVRYFVGGSFASFVFGELRTTQDVDLIVEFDVAQVSGWVDQLEPELPGPGAHRSSVSRASGSDRSGRVRGSAGYGPGPPRRARPGQASRRRAGMLRPGWTSRGQRARCPRCRIPRS
jgi:hypothetical protein